MSNAQEDERGAQSYEHVQEQPVPGHTENVPVGPDMPQSPGGGAMEDDAVPGAQPNTKPGTPPGTQSERDRLRGGR